MMHFVSYAHDKWRHEGGDTGKGTHPGTPGHSHWRPRLLLPRDLRGDGLGQVQMRRGKQGRRGGKDHDGEEAV